MILKRYGYFLLFWLLCLTQGMAQATYPIQVNVHLLPPYSLYLSDYYSGTKEKLTVTLINRDQLKPSINVRLRMIITAPGGIRIQSNDNAYIQPVLVETGSPVRLTQDDLAPYFQPNNMITQGYLSAGKLPEGMVEFCFQAIEAFTGQALSTSTCTRAWITSQKPPLLSLPRNNESVAFRDPLNVLFQWTPLHQGLALVEYDFILKELWDNGMTVQAAFPYSPEIYRETTRSTSVLYGAMQPPLIPGKRYAWCIRAKAREGLDEVNLFQNDGYSEIRSFILQDNCLPLQYVTATVERKRLNLEWNTLPEYIGFTVSYRLKAASGQTQAEWREQQTQDPKAIVYGLQNGGTYEYRVGSMCMAGQPIYSPVFSITLPQADSARLAQCGILPAVNLTNQEPITELKTGEEFKAGDFPITVVSISGSKGSLSGQGWTIIPWLNDAKIAVEFTSITINTDRQMTNGFVEAKYDKKEGQIANIDEVFEGGFDKGVVSTGLTKTDYKFDFSIPGVEAFALNDGGELVITDSEGEPHTVTPPDKEGQGNEGNNVVVFPMTVQDKDGKVYQVEKVTETDSVTGKTKEVAKATYIGTVGEALAEGSFDPTQLNGDKAIVTFAKGNGKYAFDTWLPYYDNVSLIENKYEKLYTNYYAPWKFLPSGQGDKVSATIEIKDQNIKPENVIFKTKLGTEYHAEYSNGLYTLQVAPGPEGDVQELYALYRRDSTRYYTLGKLGIATYDPQSYNVVLVSVNGAPSDANIEQKLKDIYGPVGITWSAQRDAFDYTGNIMLMENSTGISTYNDLMRALNNAYKAELIKRNKSVDPGTNYLFFLKATGAEKINNREAVAFMPRGAQFGYVFTSEIEDANEATTVAHELGHGRWKLSHTFDKRYGAVAGSSTTDNLMDYNNGGHIAKWQWDILSDPAMLVSVFEGDERSAKEEIITDEMVTAFEIAFKEKYATTTITEGCSWLDLASRYYRIKNKFDSEEIAWYAVSVKLILCATEKENCGKKNIEAFACGFINGLVQELDWITLYEQIDGISITKEKIGTLLKCAVENYPIGENINNPTVGDVLFKCITGVEVADLQKSINNFIVENWDEPYYQGQATAFVLTFISPFKGAIVKKVKNLFPSKLLKLEKLSLAKNADELVRISKSVSKAEDFVEGVVNGIRRYNVGGDITNGVAKTITRQITINGRTINLKWNVNSNGIIDFGNRDDLAKLLGTVDDEAHHILTWIKSGEHSVVQAAARDGFHLNTFENGIGLSKYKKSLNEGLHGNHPAYDDYVVHRLSEYRQKMPNYTPESANEFIQKVLVPDMRDLIDAASKSNLNLNEYFKQIVNPSVGTLLK